MDKKQIIVVHGGAAYKSHETFLNKLKEVPIRDPHAPRVSLRWCDNMRESLPQQFEIFTPSMPNKDNAQYEEWKIWFEKYLNLIDDEVILIGWSLGALFLQKYLIENAMSVGVKAVFLVAPPVFYFVDRSTGEDAGDFNYDIELLPKLRGHSSDIIVYHSKDDVVVPYEHALKLKELLPEAELITFENRGHFLQEDFPELIEYIKKNE